MKRFWSAISILLLFPLLCQSVLWSNPDLSSDGLQTLTLFAQPKSTNSYTSLTSAYFIQLLRDIESDLKTANIFDIKESIEKQLEFFRSSREIPDDVKATLPDRVDLKGKGILELCFGTIKIQYYNPEFACPEGVEDGHIIDSKKSVGKYLVRRVLVQRAQVPADPEKLATCPSESAQPRPGADNDKTVVAQKVTSEEGGLSSAVQEVLTYLRKGLVVFILFVVAILSGCANTGLKIQPQIDVAPAQDGHNLDYSASIRLDYILGYKQEEQRSKPAPEIVASESKGADWLDITKKIVLTGGAAAMAYYLDREGRNAEEEPYGMPYDYDRNMLRPVLIGDMVSSMLIAGVGAIRNPEQDPIDNMIYGAWSGLAIYGSKLYLARTISEENNRSILSKPIHSLGISIRDNLFLGHDPLSRFEIDFGPILLGINTTGVNPRSDRSGYFDLAILPYPTYVLIDELSNGAKFDKENTLKTGSLFLRVDDDRMEGEYAGCAPGNMVLLRKHSWLEGVESEDFFKKETEVIALHEAIHTRQYSEMSFVGIDAISLLDKAVGFDLSSWIRLDRDLGDWILISTNGKDEHDKRLVEREPMVWYKYSWYRYYFKEFESSLMSWMGKMSSDWVRGILTILFIPATFLHEIGHIVFAKLSGGQVVHAGAGLVTGIVGIVNPSRIVALGGFVANVVGIAIGSILGASFQADWALILGLYLVVANTIFAVSEIAAASIGEGDLAVLREFAQKTYPGPEASKEEIQPIVSTKSSASPKVEEESEYVKSAKEAIGKLVHCLMAASYDEEGLVLALDTDIGSGVTNEAVRMLMNIFPEVEDNNACLKFHIKDKLKLTVYKGPGKEIAAKVRRLTEKEKNPVRPENIIVVAKKDNEVHFGDLGNGATLASVDDTDFPESAYLPIVEIITLALLKHLGVRDGEWKAILESTYRAIPNIVTLEELMAADPEAYNTIMDSRVSSFIIKLLPNAKALDPEILRDYYDRIRLALTSA